MGVLGDCARRGEGMEVDIVMLAEEDVLHTGRRMFVNVRVSTKNMENAKANAYSSALKKLCFQSLYGWRYEGLNRFVYLVALNRNISGIHNFATYNERDVDDEIIGSIR